MKKTLVSIVAASLLALNFTGCGSSSSSTADESREVKVGSIASVVDAMVKSGALTASQLGNGFYKFDSKPADKMVSSGGFIDYNDNNTKDDGEPTALTLSADADKSSLNAFTTLVTESSKSEQEIADLFGITVSQLNSDTTLADLEVQKRAVLANAVVKSAQGSVSTTEEVVETTTPVESGETATTETTETETSDETTTTTTETVNVLPSIDGSSSATTTASITTDSATTATEDSSEATEDSSESTVAEVDTGDILPSINRSLRGEGEDSTTPPILPTVTATSTSVTNTSSSDDGVLPTTEASTNKYDELLAKITTSVESGSSIYTAVANATGVSELANLESATDSASIQAINTAMLSVSADVGDIIPSTSPATSVPATPVPTPVVTVTPVPSATPVPTPVPTPTPTPTPTPSAEPTPLPTVDGSVGGDKPLVVKPDTGSDDDYGID